LDFFELDGISIVHQRSLGEEVKFGKDLVNNDINVGFLVVDSQNLVKVNWFSAEILVVNVISFDIDTSDFKEVDCVSHTVSIDGQMLISSSLFRSLSMV
jgi:hypothetical protein